MRTHSAPSTHHHQPTEPIQLSMRVVEEAGSNVNKVLRSLYSTEKGLTEKDALFRLKRYGKNTVSHEKPPTWYLQLLQSFNNSFVYILVGLATVSYFMTDFEVTIILAITVIVSGGVRFVQEYRSTQATAKLKALLKTTATVSRRCRLDGHSKRREIPIEKLVPGDIVHLATGDMIPADVRLLWSKDLFVSQAALTGKSLPVEKYDTLSNIVQKRADNIVDPVQSWIPAPDLSRKEKEKCSWFSAFGFICGVNPKSKTSNSKSNHLLDNPTIGFMGTTVVSGTATAVVVATGNQTYFGSLAKTSVGKRALTRFKTKVNRVSWLLMGFMAVLVALVFVINTLGQGNWVNLLLFSISIAVALTPEMLSIMVTAKLTRAAIVMAKQKVMIKRLNSIQNLGAIDVLCTNKTGTLTLEKIILERHLDLQGYPHQEPLLYGYLNSYFQTGFKNLLDAVVLEHVEFKTKLKPALNYRKVDEIPFDFIRRRMSVVVEERGNTSPDKHILICKGAVEEIFHLCSHAKYEGQIVPMSDFVQMEETQVAQSLNEEGFRVIAVAYKEMPILQDNIPSYGTQDECDLILVGYLAFFDPPKDSSNCAIAALQDHGIAVKIITGDNDIVTRKICKQIGLYVHHTVLGSEVESLSDDQLADLVETTTVFAKMSPVQKARIIRILKRQGHKVGYLGDGMNDAAALRDADVGISVDTAVEIAKESADVILLEKNLMVLEQGILKGRRTFSNILKYLNITTSSNFGNIFSVMGASALLPLALGMVSLPGGYFPWFVAILVSYCLLTQTVKLRYIRKFRM